MRSAKVSLRRTRRQASPFTATTAGRAKSEGGFLGEEIGAAVHDGDDLAGPDLGHPDVPVNDVRREADRADDGHAFRAGTADIVGEKDLVAFIERRQGHGPQAAVRDEPFPDPRPGLDLRHRQEKELVRADDRTARLGDELRKLVRREDPAERPADLPREVLERTACGAGGPGRQPPEPLVDQELPGGHFPRRPGGETAADVDDVHPEAGGARLTEERGQAIEDPGIGPGVADPRSDVKMKSPETDPGQVTEQAQGRPDLAAPEVEAEGASLPASRGRAGVHALGNEIGIDPEKDVDPFAGGLGDLVDKGELVKRIDVDQADGALDGGLEERRGLSRPVDHDILAPVPQVKGKLELERAHDLRLEARPAHGFDDGRDGIALESIMDGGPARVGRFHAPPEPGGRRLEPLLVENVEGRAEGAGDIDGAHGPDREPAVGGRPQAPVRRIECPGHRPSSLA